MNQEIRKLWDLRMTEKFPHGYGGEVIDGIDLVLLDSDTAGCVITFIQNSGKLDVWRTAILGLCYRNLTVVVGQLSGEGKEHFSKLETISNLVLKDIVAAEKAQQK
jgi:hypothetical protein